MYFGWSVADVDRPRQASRLDEPDEEENVVPAQRVEQWVKPATKGPVALSPHSLVVVVGFDGSDSAYRALDAATHLISGRPGRIVAVFVAHPWATAALSPEGQVEMLKGFDALEQQLTDEIRSRLDRVEQRWRLERRDGDIADELVAAANEVSRDGGADTTIVIVVGSAMHVYHHLVGSVPVALVRHAKYPIVVVPERATPSTSKITAFTTARNRRGVVGSGSSQRPTEHSRTTPRSR